MQLTDNQQFSYNQNFKTPRVLDRAGKRTFKNKDRISYSINVLKDQPPQIVVDHLRDSILYKTILLGGTISDDYGISALASITKKCPKM